MEKELKPWLESAQAMLESTQILPSIPAWHILGFRGVDSTDPMSDVLRLLQFYDVLATLSKKTLEVKNKTLDAGDACTALTNVQTDLTSLRSVKYIENAFDSLMDAVKSCWQSFYETMVHEGLASSAKVLHTNIVTQGLVMHDSEASDSLSKLSQASWVATGYLSLLQHLLFYHFPLTKSVSRIIYVTYVVACVFR